MSDTPVFGNADWLLSFVEAAQADRERRENHTEDVWRAVREYTAAADRKIADALGDELDSLLPSSRTGTSPSTPTDQAGSNQEPQQPTLNTTVASTGVDASPASADLLGILGLDQDQTYTTSTESAPTSTDPSAGDSEDPIYVFTPSNALTTHTNTSNTTTNLSPNLKHADRPRAKPDWTASIPRGGCKPWEEEGVDRWNPRGHRRRFWGGDEAYSPAIRRESPLQNNCTMGGSTQPTMEGKKRIIQLDGRTGEGGGQLVRIACALAAVANQPVRITDVRGNRDGPRGGGLKSQHVTAIDYLAKATCADVDGLSIGSKILEFRPQLRPSSLTGGRNVKITADSPAASTMLIFQAVFPFLLFAGNDKNEPINLDISGGTNVSFSLSYEYLDQVLLPALQDGFGIQVERKLLARGWSLGKQQRGRVQFKFKPLKPGEALTPREGYAFSREGPMPVVEDVERIDVSMIVPGHMIDLMRDALVGDLDQLFPDVDVEFKVEEDSGAESRIYVLLVAHAGDVRWGRDVLTSMHKKSVSMPKKSASRKGGNGGAQTADSMCATLSRKLVKELYEEISMGGVVDEHLQDQLVVFQALAEGRTSFPRGDAKDGLEVKMEKLDIAGDGNGRMRKEKADKPFGDGSTHTTTARWVTAQLLPNVAWYNKGAICEGVGMRMEKEG
ncbi:hypothetical protein VTJ49DRAFT_2372 [Mycothermus thermophilus]|uniref:RNA 3'-terminal phosphate cyclase domain-containing protein n=1 Tax=Humicola insolens TaxID=85995 RepID=A0ABR3VMY5_HUMIN